MRIGPVLLLACTALIVRRIAAPPFSLDLPSVTTGYYRVTFAALVPSNLARRAGSAQPCPLPVARRYPRANSE